MEFSTQEYWSWWPFPSSGDLTDPGIEPGSPTLKADVIFFLPSELPGKPQNYFPESLTTLKTETGSLVWNGA